MLGAVMKFISDINERKHREELGRKKHLRTIFEKSYGVSLKYPNDALKGEIPKREREELFNLLSDIVLHEIYFSSFENIQAASERIRSYYGSEAAFLYALYESAKQADGGFLLIFGSKRGRVNYYAGRNYGRYLRRELPILAIDLEEHAYFLDYFFERDKYIKEALSALNISKIENSVEKKQK